jgi:hypothetical protein
MARHRNAAATQDGRRTLRARRSTRWASSPRLGRATEAKKRLDRVRSSAKGHSVSERLPARERDKSVKPVECRAEVAQRQLEEPQRRFRPSERVNETVARELDTAKTGGAGDLDVPQVRLH